MRYIALLRGINVGGNTLIRMDALKAEFEKLGFKNVVSYINSGNLAFDINKSSEKKLSEKIEKSVEAMIGRNISVMVREQSDIDRIVAKDPFKGKYESHKEMHVLFMKDEMPADKEKLLLEQQSDDEKIVVDGREIYCHLRLGVADSVLLGKGFIEKKLKLSTTARNWRTVQKLAEL
ncbi:MAG TPA: DUF1697 domain-containing protein [Pyrinomonadaceae bacterium]|nr:DUF1697 domain-containing protein [Pyrinomonadaceae bacterium]